MPLAHSPQKRRLLCASAILLVGLIVGLVAFADERRVATLRVDDSGSDRLDAAQGDVHGGTTSKPAKCCEVAGAMEGAAPAVTDAGTPTQDPPEKTGLPIGQAAPAFTLIDQNDQAISLESLLKKGPVAVVFHRSLDWCLYCKLQMVQLQRIQKEIEAVGGQVVAISYDSTEKIKDYAKRHKITFPLLSDVDSKTIDAYDIRYKEAPPETTGFARHAAFIIDQNGVIRSKLFQLAYLQRSAIDNLINALKEARLVISKGETR